MKRIFFSIFLVLYTLSSACQLTTDNKYVFKYTTLQGDDKWNTFKTPKERIIALQIPENTLAEIPTIDLLYVCLDYPYLYDVFAFDDINDGFKKVASKFNGLQEFVKRQDRIEALMIVFKRIWQDKLFIGGRSSEEIGGNSMKISVISHLLSHSFIIDNLTIVQREELRQTAESIIKTISYDSTYGQTLGYSSLLSLIQLLQGPQKQNTTEDYTTEVRFTPNGSPVLALKLFQNELSMSEKVNLVNYAVNNYGATVIGDATKTYNCHAYAWHVSEGGDSVWIGQNSVDENIYWEDGSYFEVPESLATKVSYDEITANHSAVRISSNLYKSKWGQGPLVLHAPNACPYDTYMPKKYYIRTPKISGTALIYTVGMYSIENLPAWGTVSWSLSGANASCFNIQSETSASHQCTITKKDDVDFVDSNNLLLTAQVKYNGTVITTLTKPLTAVSCLGPEVLCSSAEYSVLNLPNGYTVAWSLAGSTNLGLDTIPATLPEIDPSNNLCGVYRLTEGAYAKGTLVARLIYNNVEQATITKIIDTGAKFEGTWRQGTAASNSLASGHSYTIDAGKMVVLQSEKFVNATVSYTNNGLLLIGGVSHSGNTISFRTSASPNINGGQAGTNVLQPNKSIMIKVHNSNTCETFQFTFVENTIIPIQPLAVSSSGGKYTFTFSGHPEDTDFRLAAGLTGSGAETWSLEVVQLENSRAVFRTRTDGRSVVVNTIGWKPGVYIVSATANGQVYTQKIVVSK